jgi:hypothetical protein
LFRLEIFCLPLFRDAGWFGKGIYFTTYIMYVEGGRGGKEGRREGGKEEESRD